MHDQVGPLPPIAITIGEVGHIVRPPKTLQRHDAVIYALLLFDVEFERVGHREKRLNGSYCVGAIRRAMTIDHKVVEGGHVDENRLLRGRVVKVLQVLFKIGLFHINSLDGDM